MKVMLTMSDGKSFAGEVDEVPRMYDIQKDERRAVTQADVDRWQRIDWAMGKIRMAIMEFDK